MARWFRWTQIIGSRIDTMVSQIENHDARVSSAIRDAQAGRARAAAQLGRVREDGSRLRRRVAELERDREQWRERAQRLGESDSERALECLRRSRRAARERETLQERCTAHQRAERELDEDIRRIDERIAELTRQRNLLRTRQSRADALASSAPTGHGGTDLDEVLQRWEIRIATAEQDFGVPSETADEFEHEFDCAEERESLREELNELLRPSGEGAGR